MKGAGRELTFAPLVEVADITFEGIKNDDFWIYGARGGSPIQARADSAANRTPPDYMRQPVTFAPRS
jgi:hypothetical protein